MLLISDGAVGDIVVGVIIIVAILAHNTDFFENISEAFKRRKE